LVTALLAALMAPLGLVILDVAGRIDANVDAIISIAFSPALATELSVPVSLDLLVLSCLHKDPGQRPQTADDLSAKLLACQTRPWTREEVRRWWEDCQPAKGSALDIP
jgi:hypothetical protein